MKHNLGWDATNNQFVLWEQGQSGPIATIGITNARSLMATVSHIFGQLGAIRLAEAEWEDWKLGEGQTVDTALLVYAGLAQAVRENPTPDEIDIARRIVTELTTVLSTTEEAIMKEIATRTEVDKLQNQWAQIQTHAQSEDQLRQAGAAVSHKVKRLVTETREPDTLHSIRMLEAEVATRVMGGQAHPIIDQVDPRSMAQALANIQSQGAAVTLPLPAPATPGSGLATTGPSPQDECRRNKSHLVFTDSDGYCSVCGHGPDEYDQAVADSSTWDDRIRGTHSG